MLLGSGQLLTASLPSARLAVGLSWRNLEHALGEGAVERRRWALLFPARDAGEEGAGEAPLDPSTLEGVVVLDGTWSQAKTLYWRNAWLARLARLVIDVREPSIYGKLRAEPRREYVSTLEAVGAALTRCGEPPEVEAGLRRLFRTLVQRVRDAELPPEARRLPRKGRRPRG